MDKRAIMEMANSDPRFQQAVDAMEAQVANMPITPGDLDEIIKMLEFVVDNPDKYAEVVDAAIKDGVLQQGQVPEQFDPVFVISLLVALYGLHDRMSQKQGFAKGGLAQAARQLQAQGRGGDTMLAHINPREAEVLRRMGGAGTVNPNTGLVEYKGGFMQILGAVAPIALSFIAPGIGTAIGSALGASAAWAPALGGALIGGASSALSGGNVAQGALFGGLGGGLGKTLGAGVNSALGTSMGAGAQSALGGALAGGLGGALSGKGFTQGAIQGGLGQVAGDSLSKLGGFSGALGQGINAGGSTFGNALSAGYNPKQAATMGALSGLATGLMPAAQQSSGTGLSSKPSDLVVEGLKMPGSNVNSLSNSPMSADYSLTPSSASTLPSVDMGGAAGLTSGASVLPSSSPNAFGNLNMGDALKVASLASTLSSSTPPPQVQQAVQKMSPEQQAYFNRPSVYWDWDKLQNDAMSSGTDLTNYMAQNWDKISSGAYNMAQAPTAQAQTNPAFNTPAPVAKARGGALSQIANMAQGSGSGRADTIDAKLSDGEYVMDAETVAMLGDGSSKEGAKRLDQMRESLRMQKGKALSKGKFSPNAKSPLAYLKEAA